MPQPETIHAAPHLKRTGRLSDYLAIARLDHSTKHIFILPGIVFALLLRGAQASVYAAEIVLGLIAAVCIASANYTINEWLDREFDAHHPTKSARASVQSSLSGRLVLAEWLLFLIGGLACAYAASATMLVIALLFGLQGVLYNVRPARTKDRAFLDVISESINNPFRLMIGWAMVDPTTLPPGSLLLSYWLGGAFLMSAKRLSEYRQIVGTHGRPLLERYRASFAGYTEASLTVSCFVYAMLSTFFLGVFLMKYRIDYLLVMPLIITLFGVYLSQSMLPDASAQHPEKLYREKGLVGLTILIAVVFIFATLVDVPFVEHLSEQRYIVVQ